MMTKLNHGGLTPGLYFGLDEEIYHADPALGRSELMWLLEDVGVYWTNSRMNPARKKWEVDGAMRLGKALHCLLLEPHDFRDRYAVMPYDDLANKYALTGKEFKRMSEMVEVIRSMKDVNRYLSKGYSEVTVIWQDDATGLRHKARHDYMKTFLTVDYKTIASLHWRVLKRSIEQYGYDVQAELYLESRKGARELIKSGEGGVYADRKVNVKWVEDFCASEIDDVYQLFQRKDPPYSAKIIRLDDFSMDRGRQSIEEAKAIWLKHFGDGKALKPAVCDGEIEDFSTMFGYMRGGR